MTKSFEMALAERCAPTLAGIKAANLFPWAGGNAAEFARWRETLAAYGMEFRIFPAAGPHLIYLFRTARLREILSDSSVRTFLRRLGYPDADCDALLGRLSAKLRFAEEFPHEIGIFLDYPLEDVAGFMEHRGKNYAYCGCWKVYGNPEEAKRRFAEYRRYTALYCETVRAGVPLTRLIAAA